jgi:peptidoglycan/xylan/chitin deacetylase (PgdA/CDA1 family)
VNKVALRMDDVGASTKKYEVYSKNPLGNFLFLKYLPLFRAWGPYRELYSSEWEQICGLLAEYSAKLTVGITASWVEPSGELIPFPEKFPRQAEIIKKGVASGLLEVANHGLTHCVVGSQLPRLFSSNRNFHREFWDWIPREVHFAHLKKSQEIFFDWLGKRPTMLIPPGNIYSADTVEAADEYGIRKINSYININHDFLVKVIDSEEIEAFHDREVVLDGLDWLDNKLKQYKDNPEFVFVGDL